jgi:hypothetical protein
VDVQETGIVVESFKYLFVKKLFGAGYYMPFTRFTTSCFLVVIFLIAIVGPEDHPWFTNETLWFAVLFAFFVWLMSLKRDFFLDVVAILFAAFFLQRIVVIYFRPDQMSYQSHLTFSSQVFDEAIMFCIAIVIAILVGYFIATYRGKKVQKQKKTVINFDRIFGVRFNFEQFFKVYSFFLFGAVIIQLFLMFKFGVGVTALEFSRFYAPILRLTQIVISLSVFPMLVVASGKFSSKTQNTAICLVILLLIVAIFFKTSKGAFLSLLVMFLVCLHFSGRRIRKKHAIIGGILFVFTIFVLAPGVTILRAGLKGLVTKSCNFNDVLLMLVDNYSLVVDKLFFSFMNRLGGFDWLTGFMTVGRDVFLKSASLSGDVIGIINSLIPGDLIERPPDYVTTSKLMPHILRGWSLGCYPGHGGNMGGLGMAYLYFGQIGGALFFLLWSFISVKIVNSNINIIVKVLFFQLFVIVFFLGGGLETPIRHFYEAVIVLILVYFVVQIIRPRPYMTRLQAFADKTN